MAFPTYRFGDLRLDPANRKLWRGDEELCLPPKPFNCLVYLVEHRDRAVEHDELIHAVWGDACLSDRVLAKNISDIRHALHDNGEAQEYIETLRGFGYRFAAPVDTDEPLEESTGLSQPVAREAVGTGSRFRDRPLPFWMPLVLLALAALVAGAFYLRRDAAPPPRSAPPPPRAPGEIALLLPVTVDADSEHAWTRLGLMELIASRLREAGQAMVPSDTVIAMLRGQRSDPGPDELGRLAETTGAHLVLAASAQATGTRWTVSLHSLLGARPPLTAVGEAHDVLEAARTAADRLLLALGRSPAPEPSGEPALRRLVQRIEAARLAQQMDVARELIEEADPRLRRHPRIRFERGYVAFKNGDLDTAQATFEALLREPSAERDPELRALLLNSLGAVHATRHDFDMASPLLEEAARLLADRDTLPVLGTIWMNLGNMAQERGDLDSARGYLAQARRIYEGIGDVQRLAVLEESMGLLAVSRERYAEASRRFESAVERHAAVQNVGGELLARALAMLADLWLLDPQAASQVEPRMLELLAQTNNPALMTPANLARADLLHATGRCRTEKALLEEMTAAAEATLGYRERIQTMTARTRLARHALDDGDAGRAAQSASEVLEGLEPGTTWVHIATRGSALLTLVRAHIARADLPAAARASKALTEEAERGTMALSRIIASVAQAELAAAEGRRTAAEAAFERALALAEGARVPLHILQVAQSYVPWLLDEGPRGASDPEHALRVADRVAEYADRHYEAALLQLRVYRALGPPSAWRTALARATSLAGERRLPPKLSLPPQAEPSTAAVSTAPARM